MSFASKFPRLASCCCGCSLEQGVTIIGVYSIVQSVATFYSAISVTGEALLSDGTEVQILDVSTFQTQRVLSFVQAALFLSIGAFAIASTQRRSEKVAQYALVTQLVSIATAILYSIFAGLSLRNADCEAFCGLSCVTACQTVLTAGKITLGVSVVFSVVLSFYFACVVANYAVSLEGTQQQQPQAPVYAHATVYTAPTANPVQHVPYAGVPVQSNVHVPVASYI